MKINVAEQLHIVNIMPPIDITGGVDADVFSMANYKHATIILAIGVSAAAFTKILVNEVDNFAGDNPVAIPFALYAEETALGDTLAAKEAVAAAGKTPSANDGIMYVIEIDADELSDGKGFIELSITNGVNAVLASAVAILSGARFGGDQSATAIA
ncbi:hypothetical protein LCGC14_2647430 [marine sediment metagenome]|uniref:Uncharacterized protein n=1 Tax=marine sediment metagenome TaxID=412755 RepID=A0A0F9C696_9ZZZZ